MLTLIHKSFKNFELLYKKLTSFNPNKDWLKFKDESGRSLLHYIAERGDLHILNYVLDYFKENNLLDEIDHINESPLLIASRIGKLEVILALIEAGSDVNIINSDGISSILYLSERGEEDAVLALLASGASPHVKDQINKRNLLHYAANSTLFDSRTNQQKEGITMDGILALLHYGLDINEEDKLGRTPLHYSCLKGKKLITELFIEAGIKIDHLDNNGSTCLHFSVKSGSLEVVELLLKHFKDPKEINAIEKDGITPLHLAIESRNLPMIELLLKNNADPHIEDRFRRNSFFKANLMQILDEFNELAKKYNFPLDKKFKSYENIK